MSVSFDAKSTAPTFVTSNTTLSHTNLTIGSGSNRGLVAILNFSGEIAPPTSVTVTWNGVALTQCGLTTVGSESVALYGLVNPVSGNNTLAVNWTNTASLAVSCVSFTGVDQTGGAVSFPHYSAANGNSTALSVTVTSATGNQVVAGFHNGGGTWGAISGTTIYTDTTQSENTAASYNSGAASVAMTAAISSAGTWQANGVDVLAAIVSAPAVLMAQVCL